MDSNLYISTLAFLGKDVKEILKICEENSYNLEFSSGMPYDERMSEIYRNTSIQRQPHNYFPDPKIPFVLNLASENDIIRNKSINHCKKGLELAKHSNSGFFAAHAGFCLDPSPNELGHKIEIKGKYHKDKHKALFINSVLDILETAESLDIDFLIENNVIAPFNYDGVNNPLLCCDYGDIVWLFSKIKHEKLGLLLDTAHLKVSCKTLELNLSDEFKKISPFIKAFHHSDNDGNSDSNLKLTSDYWFWDYIKDYQNYIHVLEVKALNISEIENQIQLIKKHGNI
ncbi:sugar phosphate isomerase/epimerase [Schleiferiaceae bacterium]|nr:sugar phosphate isomerase/epimerase [Schleiferiaceae bacterium]